MTRTSRLAGRAGALKRSLRGAAAALGVGLAVSATAMAQQTGPANDGAPSLEQLNREIAGARTCFNRQETLAYETMRVHTQLMVASLGCAELYGRPDAYQMYRQFTVDNAGLLRSSQMVLEARLGDRGFDDYRTVIANEEGQLVVDLGITGYCRSRESRFDSLISASATVVRAYLDELGRRMYAQQGCA